MSTSPLLILAAMLTVTAALATTGQAAIHGVVEIANVPRYVTPPLRAAHVRVAVTHLERALERDQSPEVITRKLSRLIVVMSTANWRDPEARVVVKNALPTVGEAAATRHGMFIRSRAAFYSRAPERGTPLMFHVLGRRGVKLDDGTPAMLVTVHDGNGDRRQVLTTDIPIPVNPDAAGRSIVAGVYAGRIELEGQAVPVVQGAVFARAWKPMRRPRGSGF